jgi:uncharacterized cupin superfamily protein
MHEAKMRETEHGLEPADDGWFIANLADIGWKTVPGGGTWCSFEAPSTRSKLLGVGVHILWPGDSPGMYHAETDQEGFLVLSGECVAVVEGEERRMRPWDYLHCPPGTAHITVGAGDGPCAIFMLGTRTQPGATRYIVDAAAARHGASVPEETTESKVAYKDRPPIVPARSPWPLPPA